MSSARCNGCGLVNFGGATVCRRCGLALSNSPPSDETPASGTRKRLLKRVARAFALAGFIVFLWYASLVGTSEPVLFEQKQALDRAIDVLSRQGFSTEVFILSHLVRFRSTDSWWNRKVGHASAYAATNFPFEIVTLYPSFFEQPIDDVERASILLHEARHLTGDGEEAAFERTWRARAKLGWTRDKYGSTVVWSTVRDSTQRYAPGLFACGPDHRSDCTEMPLP